MKIGNLYWYTKNGIEHLVMILDYNYTVNGRVSNVISFQYINNDGKLGERGGCYYDEKDFVEATDYALKAVKVS